MLSKRYESTEVDRRTWNKFIYVYQPPSATKAVGQARKLMELSSGTLMKHFAFSSKEVQWIQLIQGFKWIMFTLSFNWTTGFWMIFVKYLNCLLHCGLYCLELYKQYYLSFL